MSKIANSILKGAKETLEYSEGKNTNDYKAHIPKEVDVKRIRKKVTS